MRVHSGLMQDSTTDSVSLSLCSSPSACTGTCLQCQVRALSVCGVLEGEEMAEFAALLEHTDLQPRSVLFLQGDAAAYVYTVTRGCVRLSKDLSDGRRQVVGFALPGDFLGLSLDKRFGFSADALDSVSLCRFDRREFTAFVERKPQLMRRMHEFAAHELTIAQDQMVLLGRRRAEERVAAFLLGWRDRLHKLTGADHTLALPMTRQDIADYLGLTIETVSRTLSAFVRRHWLVIIPDGVRVVDLSALKTAAG